nr:MAG TPA: hypothetical protein [Caudoviricetes sp.]
MDILPKYRYYTIKNKYSVPFFTLYYLYFTFSTVSLLKLLTKYATIITWR